MTAKLDILTAAKLLELGFNTFMRWRVANGKPLDDDITAEDIMRVEIHDTDAAIAEGQAGG